MLLNLILLVLFASLLLASYLYLRPFGIGSPLKVLARYTLSDNGGIFTVLIVGVRKGKKVDERLLDDEMTRSGYSFASRGDLDLLLRRGGFIRSHFIQSRMNDGRVCSILAGNSEISEAATLSFCEYDVFALVDEGHADHPRMKANPLGAA